MFLPEIPTYCKWNFQYQAGHLQLTTVLFCVFLAADFDLDRGSLPVIDELFLMTQVKKNHTVIEFFSSLVIFLAFPMSIVFGPLKQNLYSAALASQFANEVCFHSGSMTIYPPQHYILGPKEYLL